MHLSSLPANIGETLRLPPTKTIGQRIKYLRMLRGLTQFELAMKLPVPIHVLTVSRWERDAGGPKPSCVGKLAEIFNAPVLWLVEGKGPAPK